jgi:Coenzyme PQQ synthesis protein D (PqqD)
MQCVPQPDPEVAVTVMPSGDAILLNLGTGQYFSLNQTGALIWKLMESSTTLAGMSEALFDRFDVTPEAADETVRELMRDLKAHKLVSIPESRNEL